MTDKSRFLDPKRDLLGKKQWTVMLVEDFEEDRAVYRRYLQSNSEVEYTFIEAESGAEALNLYRQNSIDVVLLDYMLPDMTGLELLVQWQEQTKADRPPMIVLTGQGDENIAVQFLKMGAADYLVKGQLSKEKLQLSLNRAIALKKLQQEKDDLLTQLIARNEELARSNQQCQIESNKRRNLQQIVNNIPVIVYAKEVDATKQRSGKLWLINREFCRVFALEEAQVIGKSDRELFPEAIADAFAANDRLVMKTKQPLTTEEQVYHGDGTLHTYLSLKIPFFNQQQQVVSIIGIATDITEKKQIKTELKKTTAKFRNTFEQAAVGIAHVAPDGRWLRVNQKLCQIVGYTKEEFLEKTFQEITHPEDLDTDLEYVRQMLSGEIETYSMEKRYIRKDGNCIWINLTVSSVKKETGEPDYLISVVEDISDRKQLEFSLQKSCLRLSNLHQIDKAILEAQEAHVIANTGIESLEKFLSFQRTSIITFDFQEKTATVLATQGMADRTVGEDFQTSITVWQELINRLEAEPSNYITSHLSQFPQLSQVAPSLVTEGLDYFISFALRANGILLGILKVWVENPDEIAAENLEILSEVSNQIAIALHQARLYRQSQNYAIELETKVAQRTAQLEEINQELKAFSYSISHDLKAPLRAIQGFATALLEDYGRDFDDLGLEYAMRLVSSAQHMEMLIQDLLTYSRLSRTQIRLNSVNLSLVVNKAIEQLQAEIETSQAQITVEKPLLNIYGNSLVLTQVISNLISNAIKFVPSSKVPQVYIKAETTEDKVRLWIEDNGIGIKPQHQSRIFQVFERLHGSETYSGTGIGLAIAKKGMERIGGKIGVESQPDCGSRFWIEGKKSDRTDK